MRSLHRLAGVLPAVIVAAALSACSSSSTSPAQQQAQTQTLQAARALASKLQAGKVAQSTGIDLSYDKCGNGNTHVQDVAQQPLKAVDSSLAPAQFNARLVSEVSAAGWKLTAQPKPDANDVLYKIASNGLGGALFISDGPITLSAHLTIISACYDAGSAASGLLNTDSTYPVPSPSSS